MGNISKITYCRGIALVTLRNVPGDSRIIGDILTTIASNGVNVDMISQTAPQGNLISVAFTISMDSMGRLLPVINSLKQEYPDLNLDLTAGMTKFNFFDDNMVNTPGVAANVFSLLGAQSIQITMITTSTVDISILVLDHSEEQVLELCRKSYGIEPEEIPFE